MNLKDFEKPCTCGRVHKLLVKEIWIEAGAVKRLPSIVASYAHPTIICDENTYQAAYPFMKDSFEKFKVVKLKPNNLHADEHGIDYISQCLNGEEDILIAVGSGTIHDLTRYIAYLKKVEFISIPTAASVDGFVSSVAAMTWYGMKKTLTAVAPSYVLADSDIYSKAPYRLTASGISDLLGKNIALADWEISHVITGEYYCDEIASMERKALVQVDAVLSDIKAGQTEAYEKLMYALLLSGVAMQMAENSRPASGAEHHVSHLWEMQIINDYVDAYHGEKVSVGLLLTGRRYEEYAKAIKNGTCQVRDYSGMEMELLEDTFGKRGLLDEILKENSPDPLAEIRPSDLQRKLPEILKILESIPSAKDMERKLIEANCIYTMEQIGLPNDLQELTLQICPYVRNRLTFLRVTKMLKII